MFETILVPVDGSPRAEAVLARAVTLASRASARVLIFRGVTETEDAQQIERGLQRLARDYQTAGAAVDTRLRYVRYDDHEVIARGICDVARQDHAGLVVMATRGPAPSERWYYGSVAEQVLRHADCPVLAVPPAADAASGGTNAARIFVALDGSAPAEAALVPAQDLARALDAELVLVGVVDPKTALRAATDGYNESPSGAEEALEATRGYLEQVAQRVELSGVRAHVRAVAGGVPTAIVDLVESAKSTIIAMSTHGRHSLEHVAPGTVATAVLRSAHAPVLIVRPTGMRDPLAHDGVAATGFAAPLSVNVRLTLRELDLLLRALDELPYAPACTSGAIDSAAALHAKLAASAKAER